jgi:hypothetical protein
VNTCLLSHDTFAQVFPYEFDISLSPLLALHSPRRWVTTLFTAEAITTTPLLLPFPRGLPLKRQLEALPRLLPRLLHRLLLLARLARATREKDWVEEEARSWARWRVCPNWQEKPRGPTLLVPWWAARETQLPRRGITRWERKRSRTLE